MYEETEESIQVFKNSTNQRLRGIQTTIRFQSTWDKNLYAKLKDNTKKITK